MTSPPYQCVARNLAIYLALRHGVTGNGVWRMAAVLMALNGRDVMTAMCEKRGLMCV